MVFMAVVSMVAERIKQILQMECISSLVVAIKCLSRIILVLLNNIYCIPTYVLWMAFFSPLRKCNPELFWKIEGQFFHGLLAMVAMWSYTAGYDIVEQGDDIELCMEDRTLVIANHQSTADVPLLMATFNTKRNVIPNVMWIMDYIFKYTNFGIVSIIHEDFFIVSGKERRDESLGALRRHLYESYVPRGRKWMVLFPEGGFLRKRRETSQRYALKNDLPVLQHVSLPRVGALQAIMDVLGSSSLDSNTSSVDVAATLQAGNEGAQLNWVLDITIAYPEGKPLHLTDIITGYRPPCKTFLFYRLFPCDQVPKEHEKMTHWLYERFVEKEKLLEEFYRTGQFPEEGFCSRPNAPREVQQDPLRMVMLHVLFVTSSYLHFKLLLFIASYIWY